MRRSISRTLSFFSKWLAEVLREPALMLSLVFGPFLILLLFGAGTRIGGAPKPRTIVVADPEQVAAPGSVSLRPEDVGQYLEIIEVTPDRDRALAQLRQGRADLVAVLPAAPEQAIAEGKHAEVQIYTNEIDPLRDSYARAYLAYQIGALNQSTLRQAIEKAQQSSGDITRQLGQAHTYVDTLRQTRDDIATGRQQLAELKTTLDEMAEALDRAVDSLSGVALVTGPLLDKQLAQLREARQQLTELRATVDRIDRRLASATDGEGLPSAAELDQIDSQLTDLEQQATRFDQLPAEVLSAPFELKLQSVAPFAPSAIGYYAPAVLALLLQHLAVTLGALSMARVRLIGLMELLQTSPVRPGEVVVGNYLSYGTLCVIVGGVLAGLLVWLLGVPIFGSLALFAATVLLLIFCSLGLGFIISLLSSSEQQAAQLSMLVLIASVFFSGFMIFLDAIEWPARAVSYLLPTTYAIDALRDIMLRGVLRQPVDLALLGLGGLAFFLVTILLFRREFRAR